MFRGYFLLIWMACVSSVASQQTSCRVDIAFVVDNSGSIRDSNVVGQPDNFGLVLDFMKRIVQTVTVTPDGNRIASVSFGNEARVDFTLNQYTSTQDVVNAISRISYLGGNTNTTGALRVMRQQIFNTSAGDRPDVQNVAIVITDGIPTREVPQLPAEVQANKALGTRIIGVGVTKEVNETQLKTVVSNPATDYFYVDDFAGLVAILDGITNQACRTLSPPPTTSPGTAPTQPPFSGPTVAPGSCLVDVAFVVDNSGSIRDTNVPGQPDNFDQVKQFMRNIVQAVQASPGGNHFACVSYGNEAVVNFYFNQYTMTTEVINAINAINYLGGNTNTTGALRLTREDVFSQAHGDRPQVSNLLILITDGITTREVAGLPAEVQRIKDLGTRIIGVGVSKDVDEMELKEIVTDPTSDYFYVSNFTGLASLLDRIINSACQSFPSQPPPPTTNPGPAPSTTSPQVPPATSTAGRTLAPGTVCDADVAFVVDNSGSIRDSNVPGQPDNFGLVLSFMRNIVQTITASPDGNRFASVSFGNDARVDYYFDTYKTTAEVVNGINSIVYLGGNTNTTGALRLTREAVFNPSRGDRVDIPNFLLLITDGTPTREVADLPIEVQRIKAMGTRIVGIGVTRAVNETQLKSLVTNPATDYFFVSNFTDLATLLDVIIHSACQSPRPTAPASPTPPVSTVSTVSRGPIPTTALEPSGNCANPVDIVFVLDDSGSIGYDNYVKLKSFLSSLVDDFDIANDNVRVGLMTFSDNPEPRFNLNIYKTRADLKNAIANLTFIGGNTNTPAALRYVRTTMLGAAAGKRTGVPALVVLISDGGSTDKKGTQDEAYALRNTGATVVVVGVGQWIDLMELNNIASYPYNDNTILVNDYNSLPTIRQRLSSLACNGINICSTSPCQSGGSCLQDLQAYTCLCPSGRAGQNCQQTCRQGADIAFIIDSSHLVGAANFQKQLDFVRALVLSINVNSDSRVALLVAADQSYIRFNLNDFDTQLEILNGISQYYPSNQSDLAGAIRLARTQVFGSAGDRANVPNILVIITYRGSLNSTVAASEASLARDAGAHILGVGIGSMVKVDELNTLVSYPAAANAVYLTQPENIMTLVTKVSSALCNEVDECGTRPCQNGGQCTEVINGYTCTCTDSYTGANCNQAGSGRLDLNIVVDSSGSIRFERFPYVLQFISDLVEQLEVSPDKTRVGLIQYSATAKQVSKLNTYDNKQDVMQTVKALQFIGGTTNAADALRLLVPGFTTAEGGRADVPHVALVFTDGNYNQNVPDTVPAAEAVQATGARIIVFSVGTDVNLPNLQAIASEPTDRMIFRANSASDLHQMLNSVLDVIIRPNGR